MRTLDEQFPTKRVAAYTLGLLMIAAVVSLLDRQILSLLIIPIKQSLNLTDTKASLLQGLSFAMFYATMGMPFGYAADRRNRRNLIIFCMLFWSVATIACGLSHTYWQLFVARMCVGAGEAGLHPAAYSIMYDLFKPESRGRAYSLFGGAATIGHALSLILAASIVALLTTGVVAYVPFLSGLAGWKVAFIVAGLPGIVVAGLTLTVKEPKRLEVSAPVSTKPVVSLRSFIHSNGSALFVVLTVACLTHICGYGVIAWMATGFVRTYGMSLGRAGLLCGSILLIGAVLGAPLGGYLSDRLARSGLVGGRFLMSLFTAPIGAVAFAAWWLCNDVALSVVFGSIAFLTQVASTTVLPAALNDLVPNELRGRMAAFYLLVASIFGLGLGPTIVAMTTDYGFGYGAAVRYSMVIVPVTCLVASMLATWMGRRIYARALQRRANELAEGLK
jgi:MFS family permease